MSARGRLAVALVAAALVVAGGLAWWQWPAAESGPVASEAAARARAERIEELRAAIARERAALESARSRRAETEAELRELRESLERRLQRLEDLRRELGAEQGAGGAS